MKLLSILIPVYNTEKHIKDLLENLLRQIDERCEIILLNDGSTDNSLSICEAFQKENSGLIRLFTRENKGLVTSRREMLKASDGEWIWHVDSDDNVTEDAVSSLIGIIETTDCDMLLFDTFCRLNGQTFRKDQLPYDDNTVFTEDNKHLLYKKLIEGSINNLWNKVFRRSAVDIEKDYTPFCDVRNGEDCLQVLPVLTSAKKILYIKKTLYVYNIGNPGSITHQFSESMYTSFGKKLREEKQYIVRWGLWESCSSIYYTKCANAACTMLSAYVLSKRITDKNIPAFFDKVLGDDVFGESIRQCEPAFPGKNHLLIKALKKGNTERACRIISFMNKLREIRYKCEERYRAK